MKLNDKDLVCYKCVHETMPSDVSFLVSGCEEHTSFWFKEISNAMSREQDLIVRSQPIK